MHEKQSDNDVKQRYPKMLKSSLLGTLILLIVLFQFIPKFEPNPYRMRSKMSETVMEKLPDEMLKQPKEPKKIEKPKLPKKITETTKESEVTEEIEFETTFDDPSLLEEKEGEIYRIYEDAPVVVANIDPEYPEAARQLGIEGTVFLELVVETDGSVSQVKVIKSVHPLLDEAAISAAYMMTFTPAMSRDIPVRAYVTFPVNFTLTN